MHSRGGWAALTGALIVRTRHGKFGANGKVLPIPASNLPLATLGAFILWLGWFGFNGGSQLALGTLSDASDVCRIFANTVSAAACGAIAAMLLTQVRYGRIDLTLVLNGALAGHVSITAEPLAPSLWGSALIGAIGGVIVVFAVPLLDRLRVDDVAGTIPVHLVAGISGTLALLLSSPDTSFGSHFTGILAIGLFVTVASGALWLLLKATIGLRVSEDEELSCIDAAKLGLQAYQEWTSGIDAPAVGRSVRREQEFGRTFSVPARPCRKCPANTPTSCKPNPMAANCETDRKTRRENADIRKYPRCARPAVQLLRT